MKVFKYKEKKRLEPRPGTSYATVFVKFNSEQRLQLKEHLLSCAKEVERAITGNPELEQQLVEPLKDFRHDSRHGDKKYYDMEEIITDAVGRLLDDDKDISEAMIGRWNKLFQGTEWEFGLEELAIAPKVAPKVWSDLFPNQDDDNLDGSAGAQ